MPTPPFKVKALYEYNSGHEDDLPFPEGAVITVTAEEDADWYVGEYSDPNGSKKEGLFPKNFVERYEPAPPPRPNRASRPPPPPSAPAPQEQPPAEDVPEHSESEDEPPVALPPAEPEPPREERPVPPQSPPPAQAPKSPEQPPLPRASKPAPPAAPAAGSKSPPPVAEKPQSFKDRIAAFNKAAATPITPFKPSGPPSGFIKKPFVPPPPSRDAYVPPPREAAPQKIYKRDEDPEISERQAQDQENAEKAGLAPAATDEEEDTPKPTSLKERIALLQKQQMEQATRQAEAAHKEKPKRPPKKRIESHEQDMQSENTEGGEADDAPKKRHSHHPSHHPKSPEARLQEREPFSDGNEADQSAAGETTEDAEGSSTTVEDDEEKPRGKAPQAVPRAHAAPTQEPEVGDEEDATEEEEEDEVDEETRRRMELRERMAKMSGGMGMPGMFGMPMPGMKPPPKKSTSGSERKSIDSHRESEQSPPPAQRIPMIPIPGMGMPQVRSPDSEDTEMAVEKENEPAHPITDEHDADEVPDVEDIKAQPQESGAPPPLPQERPVPPPPVAAESRPVPPPPPAARPQSPGSESDDELAEVERELPVRGAPPPVPQSPPRQHKTDEPTSPSVPSRPSTSSDRRASRSIPPIPGVSSPVMSPTATSRPPPPPPPAAAPPSRGSNKDALSPRLGSHEEMEGETEYEGDYDTDIASGATHKDALKAHAREQSYDDTTLAGSPITGPPPVPMGVPRAVPPPPPQQPPPSRQSIDAPRGAPPPPPPRESMDAPRGVPPPPPRESMDTPRGVPPPPPRESMDAPRAAPPPPPREPMSPTDGDDYDPYRYGAPVSRAAPPPPSAPPAGTHEAPVPEEEDEDEIYQSPPPRRMSKMSQHHVPISSHQELPGQAENAYETPMSPPRSSMQASRKSLDAERTLGSRRSMDQSRPSIDHGHIANDVDLGQASQWWTQPNTPPPVFQNRKDVFFEIEESTTTKRGGKTIVQKDVYVLFQDYSQTVVTARFDAREPASVALEQRHEPSPQKLRQDQLEAAYEQFGRRISDGVNAKQNSTVGDGSPQALVLELLKPLSSALLPVGTRAYGALVYANLANASVQQNDEIRPGDIISLRNAKFEGKHGAMHAKYKMEVGKPDHVGVVVEWDGTKKKIRAFEQGRESKKVKVEGFRMADLRSGEVRVWRVMGRDWVGWDVPA